MKEDRKQKKIYYYCVPSSEKKRMLSFEEIEIHIVPFCEEIAKGHFVWDKIGEHLFFKFCFHRLSGLFEALRQKKRRQKITDWTRQFADHTVIFSKKLQSEIGREWIPKGVLADIPSTLCIEYCIRVVDKLQFDNLLIVLADDRWDVMERSLSSSSSHNRDNSDSLKAMPRTFDLEDCLDRLQTILCDRLDSLSDLVFYASGEEQTKRMDAWLDLFAEESGIAASCPERPGGNPFSQGINRSGVTVIVDFRGIDVNRIKQKNLIFIDVFGYLSQKQIRLLCSRKMVVKSLANSLDRGFACGL